MMNVRINMVFLGMMCIGLVVCSGRDIAMNVNTDGQRWVFCPPEFPSKCYDNEACNKECMSNSYPLGGHCTNGHQCCCRIQNLH